MSLRSRNTASVLAFSVIPERASTLAMYSSMTFKPWNMKLSKIHHFEVKGGPIYAEFQADYDYDGPGAPGREKV